MQVEKVQIIKRQFDENLESEQDVQRRHEREKERGERDREREREREREKILLTFSGQVPKGTYLLE